MVVVVVVAVAAAARSAAASVEEVARLCPESQLCHARCSLPTYPAQIGCLQRLACGCDIVAVKAAVASLIAYAAKVSSTVWCKKAACVSAARFKRLKFKLVLCTCRVRHVTSMPQPAAVAAVGMLACLVAMKVSSPAAQPHAAAEAQARQQMHAALLQSHIVTLNQLSRGGEVYVGVELGLSSVGGAAK